MGLSYEQKEETDKAIQFFEEAIGLNLQDYKSYAALGYAYLRLQKNDEAFQLFSKAIELYPDNPDALFCMGRVYGEKDDYVIVDNVVQKAGSRMEFLFGGSGSVEVLSHTDPGNQSRYVRLKLEPMQFVILK